MASGGDWLPILRRRGVPVLFYSYINQGYKDEYYQEIIGIPHGLGSHLYVDGWVVIHRGDADAFTAVFAPRLDEPDYVEFFLRQCDRVVEELLATGAAIRDHGPGPRDSADLLFDFMQLSSRSIRVMPFLNTMVFVQEAIEARLREALGAHFGLDADSPELASRMQRLMTGGDRTPMASHAIADVASIAEEVRTAFPELALRLRSEPAAVGRDEIEGQSATLWSRIAGHLREFDFLGTDYYLGEPTSLSSLCEQLSAALSRQPSSADPTEVAELRDDVDNLDESQRRLLATAQTMQYLREYRLEALFKAGRDCRDMLVAIGDAIGVSYDELLALTYEEILSSLATRSLSVPLAVVGERMAGYASQVEGRDVSILVGEERAELERSLPVATTATGSLSGVTAYPGDCEGPARVVDQLDKVGELQSGDVLIAPMTLPYHVPAMARSAAILTDEGGILSHAAIVARELRIPCVVGLGTATSAFADGERIAVRANPSGGTVESLHGATA